MSAAKVALANPDTRYSFKIISKELINHDVVKFVFELPSKDHILGTKSGQHFFIIANINNQEVYRKYTPTSLENQKGTFDVIIKVCYIIKI
jgi:cytochrome-b5 reductase